MAVCCVAKILQSLYTATGTYRSLMIRKPGEKMQSLKVTHYTKHISGSSQTTDDAHCRLSLLSHTHRPSVAENRNHDVGKQ